MADMTRGARGHQPRASRGESRLRAARVVRAGAWDSGLLFASVILCVIGLIALASASYSTSLSQFGTTTYYIRKQLIFAVLGIVAMIGFSKLSYRVYATFQKPILIVTMVLMVLVLIPGIGVKLNGARRWLFGVFQPSEILKLAVIICFAYWVQQKPDSVRTLKGLMHPYGTLLVVSAGLLILEPHTSATIIILGIAIVMLFCAGMRLWYFIPVFVGGGVLGTIFYIVVPHVRTRIEIWFDPFQDMQGDGFQGSMGQIAIGSGGIFGFGLGQGRQKHLYLPEPQNDFIFASWCEEMGFIGAVIVLALFGYLIYRGFVIAKNAPDRFSSLLAVGITAKIALQTIINLWVVTGLFPVTGASLPFFSYGGTALLMQLAEMGILLNISRYMRADAKENE